MVKRTAILIANKIMIDGGAGSINVPLNRWKKWNTLISDHYRIGDLERLKEWTYDNGIQVIDSRKLTK